MHLLQIIKENGLKYFLPVPDKLTQNIRLNNYLLIQPTVEGSEHGAEIVRIIDARYRRFYEANNVWPAKFDDPDMGDMGPETIETKKKSKPKIKKNIKKKPRKSIVQPTYEPTSKLADIERRQKEKLKEEDEESDTESDSEDDDKTRAEKRKKRLAKIGSDVIEAHIDNTTVTDAVITSREPIVKPRDEIPLITNGVAQPWSAILQRKRMTEKQIQRHIQKEIRKKPKSIRKQLRNKPQLLKIGQNVPCGAVPGQIMVPWEDLVGKYKNTKDDLDDTEE